jgi:hypothetical protein
MGHNLRRPTSLPPSRQLGRAIERSLGSGTIRDVYPIYACALVLPSPSSSKGEVEYSFGELHDLVPALTIQNKAQGLEYPWW